MHIKAGETGVTNNFYWLALTKQYTDTSINNDLKETVHLQLHVYIATAGTSAVQFARSYTRIIRLAPKGGQALARRCILAFPDSVSTIRTRYHYTLHIKSKIVSQLLYRSIVVLSQERQQIKTCDDAQGCHGELQYYKVGLLNRNGTRTNIQYTAYKCPK